MGKPKRLTNADQKDQEPKGTEKSVKAGEKTPKVSRTRAKRKLDLDQLGRDGDLPLPKQTKKSANTGKSSDKTEKDSKELRKSMNKIEDSNNNATVAGRASKFNDETTVVGTAKSLINSIKAKRAKQAANSEKGDQVNERATETVTTPREMITENEDDRNDGVEIEIDPREDQYGDDERSIDDEEEEFSDEQVDHHVNSSSEIESEYESETGSSSESSSEDEVMTEKEKLKLLRKDPGVRKLIDHLVGEKLSKEKKRYKKNKGKNNVKNPKSGKNLKLITKADKTKPPVKNVIKSPSDTTLYTPALRKDINVGQNLLEKLNQWGQNNQNGTENNSQIDMLDKISTFVDQARRQYENDRYAVDGGDNNAHGRNYNPRNEPVPHASHMDEPDPDREFRQAKEDAEDHILQAEKFKAAVAAPQGESSEKSLIDKIKSDKVPRWDDLSEILQTIRDSEDDDFYHITCHIDQSLKKRIEMGEFVDLDRLVPRSRNQVMSDDNRFQQYIDKVDGSTYWGPPPKDNKITGIRRWEQAFRVYATIFCKANPSRSAEIWQYVHIVNTAASAYVWENVAYYDFSFRQMMAEKPHRSWARTHNQLWNLAMCEPIHKNSNHANHSHTSGGSNHHHGNFSNNQNLQNQGNIEGKVKACWRFNRGVKCRKWNCDYEHRCSYCGAFNHGRLTCYKKGNNSSTSTTTVATSSSNANSTTNNSNANKGGKNNSYQKTTHTSGPSSPKSK